VLFVSAQKMLQHIHGGRADGSLERRINTYLRPDLLILDDFGRQQIRPRDLLNRWIVPLENRVDFLTLHTGKKLQMPFDELVVYSDKMEEEGKGSVELRQEAFQVAEMLAEAPRRAELIARADRLSKHNALTGIVRLLAGLVRDLTCIAGGRSASIMHFDYADELAALASRAPLDDWLEAYRLVEESLRDLEVRYANKRITLERLFLSLSER